MKHLTPRLVLALMAVVVGTGSQAQGLRISPQIGVSRANMPPIPAGPRQADHIVAVVNSEPITNVEVRTRLVRVEQQLAQQGGVLPPRDVLAQQVLERLIGEKAQLQLARDTGLKIEDSVVDQAEQNVARQNQIDVAELRRRIESDGMTPASFRAQLRDQLTLTRLREREVEPRVRVTDLEVDQFIQEQKGGGTAAEMVLDLGQVLIAVPEGATAAQVAERQARAQQVLARAKAGEDFAKLAREMSDAPSAARDGGQMGAREADRYPAVFVDAVKSVPVGGLAALVRSGAGFHVLKVLEKRQGDMPGVSVTQTRARHILLQVSAQTPESAARERLDDFKKRIEAGKADFAQLAREFSQDGSARDGGDLGWTNPGMFVPEFEDVLNSLRPGEIAPPLVSRFGVHLIQLIERRQANLSEREQREIARNLLRERKLDEAYVDWARDVRGRAYVELRDPPQ